MSKAKPKCGAAQLIQLVSALGCLKSHPGGPGHALAFSLHHAARSQGACAAVGQQPPQGGRPLQGNSTPTRPAVPTNPPLCPPPSGAGAGQGDPSGPQATNPLGTGALTHLRLLNLKVPSVPCRGPDGCTSQAVRSPGCPQLLMSPEECGSPARPRTMPPFCPASWTGPEPSSASLPPSSELDTSPNKNAPGGFSA